MPPASPPEPSWRRTGFIKPATTWPRRPPSVQSLFAQRRCYRRWGDVCHLLGRRPGRPVEFHHQSPTVPYVNLSIHTARAGHLRYGVTTARRQLQCLAHPGFPVDKTHNRAGSSPLLPLHYRRFITPTGGYAPFMYIDTFSLRGFTAYRVFSWHHMKSSHVLRRSPDQARANSTPGAVWAVSRTSPRLVLGQ